MDKGEAERWRKDKRVEYVQQDMLGTVSTIQVNPGWGLDRIDETSVTNDSGTTDNYPTYQDGELIIPRIDTAEQVGNFQDVKFIFNEQTGTWKLEEFKTKTTHDTLIIDVELIVTNTMPVQIFLKVDGALVVACSELGQISEQIKDERFKILIPITINN